MLHKIQYIKLIPMSLIDKFMRRIGCFDLPTETCADTKNYTKFVKKICRNGYIRTQYSIYCKMVVNSKMSDLELNWLKTITPVRGERQVLIITEKQYASIEYIIGERQKKIIDSVDKIIFM